MASHTGRDSGLAQRYAGALYDLADERRALDGVAADLRAFRDMLDGSSDLVALVRSPVLGRSNQVRALQAIARAAEFSELTSNFLALVARNRRLFAVRGMIDAFLRTLAERRGEIAVAVTSAHALDEDQVTRLTDQLREMMGSKVTVETSVDPSLLGGLVVRVGSRMFDSSLKTKLQRLQLAMKGVG